MLFFPTRKVQEEQAVGATYCKKIDSLLQQADFVMLVVSLTPQTHKLIGKRELELMKPTATLINISRGTTQIHWLLQLHPAQLGHMVRHGRDFSLSLLSSPARCTQTLLFHTRCSSWPRGAAGSTAKRCYRRCSFGCHLPRATAQVAISACFSGRMGEPCWAQRHPCSRQEAGSPAPGMSLDKSAMNTSGMQPGCCSRW